MIGAHIDSNPNNILYEAHKIKKYGGNIVQLFVETLTKKMGEYVVFVNFLKENDMKCVIHASYTINCSQTWDFYSWWIKQFILEIEMAAKLDAIGIVVHMGKQLQLSKEESLNNMYTALLYVHNQTKHHPNIKIFLETSTGQGSEICYKLDDLIYFYKKLSDHKNESIRDRFGICLDTCHIFSAGHDISTMAGIKEYLNKFNESIGIEHVKLIHLNDSKKELGSHVDRHENIGKGQIGKKSLLFIAKWFKELNVPIILETSSEHHKIEINMLR